LKKEFNRRITGKKLGKEALPVKRGLIVKSAAFGAVMLTLALVGAAFAADPIRLIVNGREIKTDVPPQLIGGRAMVPVRWVAEALGAVVEWDEESGSVFINTPQPDLLRRRVSLLEEAVAPDSPQEAYANNYRISDIKITPLSHKITVNGVWRTAPISDGVSVLLTGIFIAGEIRLLTREAADKNTNVIWKEEIL